MFLKRDDKGGRVDPTLPLCALRKEEESQMPVAEFQKNSPSRRSKSGTPTLY